MLINFSNNLITNLWKSVSGVSLNCYISGQGKADRQKLIRALLQFFSAHTHTLKTEDNRFLLCFFVVPWTRHVWHIRCNWLYLFHELITNSPTFLEPYLVWLYVMSSYYRENQSSFTCLSLYTYCTFSTILMLGH